MTHCKVRSAIGTRSLRATKYAASFRAPITEKMEKSLLVQY